MKRKIMAVTALLALVVTGLVATPASAGTAPIRVMSPAGQLVEIGKPLAARSEPIAKQRPRDGKAQAKLLTTAYWYAGGYQYPGSTGSDGASAKFQFVNPYRNTADTYHSLGQISVESADGLQSVEAGFIKSNTVCASTSVVCLFVNHSVNNVYAGYSAGFVPASGVSHAPGDTLTTSASYPSTPVLWRIGIQYFSGNWWIGMDSTPGTFEWIGYFPGTDYSSQGVTFTKMGLGQQYGEVATTGAASTSDMGNGQPGRSLCCPINTNVSAATINSWTLINPPSGVSSALTWFETDDTKYRVSPPTGSVRTMFYGGGGTNGIG